MSRDEIEQVQRFQAQIEALIQPAWDILTAGGMVNLAIALERIATKLRRAAAEKTGWLSSGPGRSPPEDLLDDAR